MNEKTRSAGTGDDLDVTAIRADFPALADGYAYLDGAAGTQTPNPVIDAIADAYRLGLSNTDGPFPASQRSNAIIAACRQAVADLVGGQPQGVILGPNMTTLTYRLSAAIAKLWGHGDEIVVSQLDHDANVRPWVQAAERSGVTVRWARVDVETGELNWEQYQELVGPRTRLVAVTAASNVLGIRPQVERITEIAHAAGALTYVDGVHATPHGPIDIHSLGADFYLTSAYKWCGPHIGAAIATPALLESLHPDKLIPASDDVPDRFQTGTAPFADFAGVTAAVDHLAGLLPPGNGERRAQLLATMAAVESYESKLFEELKGGLGAMPHVTLYGHSLKQAPTAYFQVANHSPEDVAAQLAAARINVWSGDNYAWEVVGALGLRAVGGAVRASLVHYNNREDVSRLLDAVDRLRS
ncbi:MAG: cysteine desulfurase-like protein [Candidatus Dormibacteria bacterium]